MNIYSRSPPCYRFLQKRGADGQVTTSGHTLPVCDLEGVSPQGVVSLHPSAESLCLCYPTTAAPRSRQELLERRKDIRQEVWQSLTLKKRMYLSDTDLRVPNVPQDWSTFSLQLHPKSAQIPCGSLQPPNFPKRQKFNFYTLWRTCEGSFRAHPPGLYNIYTLLWFLL